MSTPIDTQSADHPAGDAKQHFHGRCSDAIEVGLDRNWPRPGGTTARLFETDQPVSKLRSKGNFEASIRVREHTQQYACFDVRLTDGLARTPGVLALNEAAPALLLLADDLAILPECAAVTRLVLDPPLQAPLVLFDVDGTLVDSIPAYIEVGRLAAEAHGYTLSEQFVRDTMNRNNHAFWELVVPEQTTDRGAILESLRATSRQHWPRLVEEMVRPFAGVRRCVESLRSAGHQLGIVTASGGGSMRSLTRAGLDEFFDVVVTRHDVATQKPAPDGIEHAMHKLSRCPVDTVYVGDSLVDIQAAQAAGVDCVAVTTGAGQASDLARAGPRRLISQIDTLPELLL